VAASDIQPRDRPLIDVLDRVLSKGIVILYDVDVSIAGLRVLEVSGRTVILSLETYTKMTEPPTHDAEASDASMEAVTAYLRRLPVGETETSRPRYSPPIPTRRPTRRTERRVHPDAALHGRPQQGRRSEGE